VTLAGRTAVVTGGSRGIGLAIAHRLAREGARVLLVAREAQALREAVEAIEAQGGQAGAIAVDVTDRDGAETAVRSWTEREGPIEILVNDAGGNVRKRAEAYAMSEWDALLALNLSAAFHWSALVFPGMRSRGFGRIVNVSSVAAEAALPTGVAYAAAKAGLEAMTRNLAREWGPHGITVNAVAPWYVETPLTADVLSRPGYRDAVIAHTPLGRLGTADDVAGAVAFLCGPDGSWITGVTLPVDGGFTASAFFPPAAGPSAPAR
jgi:NAD(P)-dependent dehydrogenase (short-subunit alcohol dehydrogenase family)